MAARIAAGWWRWKALERLYSTPGPRYCQHCGHPNDASATYCAACGKYLNA